VRLRRVLATFEAFDSAFDGFVRLHLTGCQASPDNFNRPANPLLDKVHSEVGFVAELVVEGAFGFRFRSDVVAVVVTRNAPRFWLAARFLWNLATPVPAPLARGVGAVFELLDSLSKGGVDSFGSIEFDDGGTTVFHCTFTYIGGVTYMFRGRRVTVAWFVSSTVGFLHGVKPRGIRLDSPVNEGDASSLPHRGQG